MNADAERVAGSECWGRPPRPNGQDYLLCQVNSFPEILLASG